MNRRGFITGLAGMLAARQAAAFVPASSLMKIKPIILPEDKEFSYWNYWHKVDIPLRMGRLEPAMVHIHSRGADGKHEYLGSAVDGDWKAINKLLAIRK